MKKIWYVIACFFIDHRWGSWNYDPDHGDYSLVSRSCTRCGVQSSLNRFRGE